ncbi:MULTISPECIES: hypothetical protein [unclassified Lysobacter]|uniref:hypothetical protein n=1 Tax=unclassified Lysobacter TaxID=2635362 RepID=UPI001BEB6115|nr:MULTISPECIES: hypothetical protein [unclassified Lysobacter]MBT2746983.1 hypothetical protein [Lysobacter sp. ISL-42]MBT2750555.1 hypothetical protein [Lysobacter sp. ISL-50]MBT2776402.1 hypothetical protein [Lysobacter sp. ISL-54]MBT2780896.1 hypothetical protein [Lysobacter sp. ISL-52]
MNPAAPLSAESSQGAVAPGRSARSNFHVAGIWLFVLAGGVVVTGLVAYGLILRNHSDGMGVLATIMALVTVGIAAPLGLIGAVLWLIGVVRANRSGNARS